jgi:hypothetical protein
MRMTEIRKRLQIFLRNTICDDAQRFNRGANGGWQDFVLPAREADNLYWDGKVHKATKFGDAFDSRTVKGRKKAAVRAAHFRLAKAELEALRAEERSWSFWGTILRRFGRG